MPFDQLIKNQYMHIPIAAITFTVITACAANATATANIKAKSIEVKI